MIKLFDSNYLSKKKLDMIFKTLYIEIQMKKLEACIKFVFKHVCGWYCIAG